MTLAMEEDRHAEEETQAGMIGSKRRSRLKVGSRSVLPTKSQSTQLRSGNVSNIASMHRSSAAVINDGRCKITSYSYKILDNFQTSSHHARRHEFGSNLSPQKILPKRSSFARSLVFDRGLIRFAWSRIQS
jgi:hypothetical protein